jgi:hypothetical protein
MFAKWWNYETEVGAEDNYTESLRFDEANLPHQMSEIWNPSSPATAVIILKVFSPKSLANVLAFLAQTTASFFSRKIDHNNGFWEKRHFFLRKLANIAENCDHNIDPWIFIQYIYIYDAYILGPNKV